MNRHFGFTDVEFVWEQDRTLNAFEQAKIDDIYVRAGVLSIDEVRAELGKRPIGAANAVITTTGIFPLQTKDLAENSAFSDISGIRDIKPQVDPAPEK